MTKWEYHFHPAYNTEDNTVTALENIFNYLGEEGWELVIVMEGISPSSKKQGTQLGIQAREAITKPSDFGSSFMRLSVAVACLLVSRFTWRSGADEWGRRDMVFLLVNLLLLLLWVILCGCYVRKR